LRAGAAASLSHSILLSLSRETESKLELKLEHNSLSVVGLRLWPHVVACLLLFDGFVVVVVVGSVVPLVVCVVAVVVVVRIVDTLLPTFLDEFVGFLILLCTAPPLSPCALLSLVHCIPFASTL